MNDDTISRQAAIDAMRKCQTYRFSATEPRMIMLATAEEVIEELPSVQLTHDCDTCRYRNLEWDEEPCDSCTSGGVSSHWKPPAQPDWGKPVGKNRPLADSDIIPRLQDIKRQIGGSYAIDRAVEVLLSLPSAQPEPEHTMEEFMYGQDLGSPEDGSL